MHLHEKRCIKRAGVAGIALRAMVVNMYQELIKNYLKNFLVDRYLLVVSFSEI